MRADFQQRPKQLIYPKAWKKGTHLKRGLNLEILIEIRRFGLIYVNFDWSVVKAIWNVQISYLVSFSMKEG